MPLRDHLKWKAKHPKGFASPAASRLRSLLSRGNKRASRQSAGQPQTARPSDGLQIAVVQSAEAAVRIFPTDIQNDSSSSSSDSVSQTSRRHGGFVADLTLLYPTKYIQNWRGRKKRHRASSASSQASRASQVSDASLEPAAATLEALEDSLEAYKNVIKRKNKNAWRFMKAVQDQEKAASISGPSLPEYPGRVSPQFKSALEAIEKLSWKVDRCRSIFDTDEYQNAEYISKWLIRVSKGIGEARGADGIVPCVTRQSNVWECLSINCSNHPSA